jgi:hypothetical protein
MAESLDSEKKERPLLGNCTVNTFLQQQINTQQWRNCWKRCFLCSPCQGNTVRISSSSSSPVREWVTPSRRGVTSSCQAHPLVEKEAPLLNMYMSRRDQTSWSWIPIGLETKNCLAGNSQQQFNQPTNQPTDRPTSPVMVRQSCITPRVMRQ